MTAYIAIDWTHGRPHKGADEDEDRAARAAQRVLDAAKADYTEAQAEYHRQFERDGGEYGMTGLAALWVEASSAADRALTDGWDNPNGASCTITAVEL